MELYKKYFTLNIKNDSELKRKLQEYFQFYNFELSEKEENQYNFFKKTSFLNGWNYNPLNWASTANIKITDNKLEISYINEGNSQITPFAFDELFTSFFNNLDLFLNKSIDFKEENSIEIKIAKKKVIYQFLIILFSIACFVILSKLLFQNFNLRFFESFVIAIGAIFSLKLLNQYWIHKIAES